MHRKFKYRITTVRPIVGLPWYVRYLFFNDFHVLKITSCQWCLNAGDLPEHKVVGMPNLSPTMETGTIISWMKKEGKVLVGLTIMIILQFGNWKTKPVKTSYLCILWLPIWLDLTIPLSIHILTLWTRKRTVPKSTWCLMLDCGFHAGLMIATFSVSDTALLQGWIYVFWLAPLTTSN